MLPACKLERVPQLPVVLSEPRPGSGLPALRRGQCHLLSSGGCWLGFCCRKEAEVFLSLLRGKFAVGEVVVPDGGPRRPGCVAVPGHGRRAPHSRALPSGRQ